MKQKLRRLMILLTVLALVPFSAMAESASTESADTDTNANGMPYVLNEFEGTALDLTQYQGKAIWLNFFTSWCSYCMKEMPYIKQVFEDYDPEQVEIILIHVWDGDNADDSKTVIEKFGLQDMNMLEDEDMTLAAMVGLSGYPTSYFIDKEGYLYGGAYGLDYDGMATYMDGMGVGKLSSAANGSETANNSETANRTGSDATTSPTPAEEK